MVEIVAIKHRDLDDEMLETICKIKSTAWDYSLVEQKRWIAKNLKDSDSHVLLMVNDEYVAYLNLIKIKILRKKVEEVNGIGNVCAKYKGKGFGSQLIQMFNLEVNKEQKKVVLLCKFGLIPFYQKLGYTLNFQMAHDVFVMSINIGQGWFKLLDKPF